MQSRRVDGAGAAVNVPGIDKPVVVVRAYRRTELDEQIYYGCAAGSSFLSATLKSIRHSA